MHLFTKAYIYVRRHKLTFHLLALLLKLSIALVLRCR